MNSAKASPGGRAIIRGHVLLGTQCRMGTINKVVRILYTLDKIWAFFYKYTEKP